MHLLLHPKGHQIQALAGSPRGCTPLLRALPPNSLPHTQDRRSPQQEGDRPFQPQLPQQGMQGESASKIASATATKGFTSNYQLSIWAVPKGRQKAAQDTEVNAPRAPTCSRFTGKGGHCLQQGSSGTAGTLLRRGAVLLQGSQTQPRHAAEGLSWEHPKSANYSKGLCSLRVEKQLFHGHSKMVQIITTLVYFEATSLELQIWVQETYSLKVFKRHTKKLWKNSCSASLRIVGQLWL